MAPPKPSFFEELPRPTQHCTAYLKNDKTSVSKDNSDKISMNVKAVKDT